MFVCIVELGSYSPDKQKETKRLLALGCSRMAVF